MRPGLLLVLLAQVRADELLVLQKLGAGALGLDLAQLQHVGVIGNLKGLAAFIRESYSLSISA